MTALIPIAENLIASTRLLGTLMRHAGDDAAGAAAAKLTDRIERQFDALSQAEPDWPLALSVTARRALTDALTDLLAIARPQLADAVSLSRELQHAFAAHSGASTQPHRLPRDGLYET